MQSSSGSTESFAGLSEADLDPDPIREFDQWFQRALSANIPEPTAMTLATSSKEGAPSARIVLLKAFDDRGFSFYTNYESPKGRDLADNPRAALVFFWPTLQRQIRINGNVAKVSVEESRQYFCARPFGSRCGAWASKQSEVIQGREDLEARFAKLTAEYQNKEVPLPPYWGGYRVTPTVIEFWQGRPSRLHDRFRYTLQNGGGWKLERLSP